MCGCISIGAGTSNASSSSTENLFDLDGHYSGVVHATVEADESAHFPEYVAEHVVGLHISTVVHGGDDAVETEVLALEVLRIG